MRRMKPHRKNEYIKTTNFFGNLMRAFAAPPNMTVSDWADRYRILSPEASAERGKWHTDRAPYQREIMNAISDPRVERVIIKSSAQVGKTEILLNAMGYFIDCDPSPMLYVQPTDDMAEAFSKDRLAPMLRDCPTLAAKIDHGESKRKRAASNTTMHKSFPGGHITMLGANTPAKLASRPIRVVFLDEVDRFPQSAGKEGDPVALAIKRTTTFWNRKIVEVSTPTIKGASKIDDDFEDSSAEELEVRCPDCGVYQPYVWEQLKFEHKSGSNQATVIGYVCRACGCVEKEALWKRQAIKWTAKHPEQTKKRGFHLNELASPWKRWDEIVEDFLTAKHSGRNEMKVWHNTALGLSWEEVGDLDLNELLLRRRMAYNCEVPEEALVLTAGVDVQDNRLEYEIVAWGAEKQSWGIRYGVIMGCPGQPQVWEDLDQILFADYIRADGQKMVILTTCIDSGGHYTTEVYAYCKARQVKRVWAIKGQGGSGVPYIKRPKRRNDSGAWLFIIGVDVGKDTIAARLDVKFEHQAGYCHFPMESDRGYDQQYFEGLTAERRTIHTVKGRTVIQWVKRSDHARNEPFDIRNYATAALEILDPKLQLLEQQRLGIMPQRTQQTQKKRTSKGIEVW